MVYDDIGDRILIDRQRDALKSFKTGYVMNPFLATALFCPEGRNVENSLKQPIDTFYQENLNHVQKEAVQAAISSNGMFLIQGPPGTGKTQVIAEITTQLVKQGKKVLIASENNKAVDNAFTRLPKDPMIRPLRLLHDKRFKDNHYSLESLLKNFYENISKTLDGRISEYRDFGRYKESFKERMNELEMRFKELNRLEEDIKGSEKKVKEKQKELREIDVQISEIKIENKRISDKLDELKDKLSQIASFKPEDDAFDRKVRDTLNKYGIDTKDEEYAPKYAKMICDADNTCIISEISRMKAHSEYFDMMSQKARTESPSKISELNEKMSVYEKMNTFSISDFPILSLFGGVIPEKDDIDELKQILNNIRKKEEESIKNEIDALDGTCKDPQDLIRQRKNVQLDIDEIQEEKPFQEYEAYKGKFHSEVQKVFSELRITEAYKSMDEALRIIKDEWRHISKDIKKNEEKNKRLVPIYEDISRYLADESVLNKDLVEYTERLSHYVNVVGMTCTSKNYVKKDAINIDVKKIGIDVVIIDEVSKIPFVELLQPILYGKTVILVGDHKQLSPMYTSDAGKDPNWEDYDSRYISKELDEKFNGMYEDSLFKRLFNITPDSSKTTLDVQYRMHPQIMKVDNEFYADTPLKFGGNERDKEHYLNIKGATQRKIIGENNHILFVDCKGREKKESGSTSYSNREEAEVIVKLLGLLNQNCNRDRNNQPLKDSSTYRKNDERLSVGVICTYADQAKSIRKSLKNQKPSSFNNSNDEKFMIKTVDDFQGDERDIIILSMVRTNPNAKFLQEYRRINVAMSRARRLLIIVGNSATLSKMVVEVDSSTGNKAERKRVYGNIIRTIKNHDGYITSEDIIGGS